MKSSESNNSSESVESPKTHRLQSDARWLRRRSFSLPVAALLIATLGSWPRSYEENDHLAGRIGHLSFLICAREGRIGITVFQTPRAGFWRWGFRSVNIYPQGRGQPVIPRNIRNYSGRFGVGWIESWIIPFDSGPSLRKKLLLIPHSLLGFLLWSCLVLLFVGRRFTLLALFVWFSFSVVLFGSARASEDELLRIFQIRSLKISTSTR